ncbi:hypothetical protein [Archangium lipolyticum]|uniref:hypothetical protein n=1 Tax=Archangium lipolyticum TaxID=2970465 RepID=UPI00214A4CE1|nr:hypothetical protein [Archangium lipolyticum]
MVRGNTRPTSFSSRMLVAYLIAYAISAAGVVLGFFLRSVPWLSFGLWLAASLSVILIDRAVTARMPQAVPSSRERRENPGSMFQSSPAALTVIGIMAVAALIVSLFAHW